MHVIEDRAKPYSIDELIGMPRRIDFSRYDLLHVPHFTLPFRVGIPTVVTVHDLIHMTFPEKRYYPFVSKILIRSALKRATKVLTVSQASYKDLSNLCPSHKRKISVVPNALDPMFVRERHSKEYLASRFGLRGRYLMAVMSMLKPHKGLSELLKAFRTTESTLAQMRANADSGILSDDWSREYSDLKLVLVGKGIEDLTNHPELLNLAGALRGVRIFGSVSKEDLCQLYGGADALIVPSFAEGFCLPVLEAKSFGTPVIARPVPALMELCGSGDWIAPDFSEPAFESTIMTALREMERGIPVKRREQIAAATCQHFQREDIAQAVLSVYREALSSYWKV